MRTPMPGLPPPLCRAASSPWSRLRKHQSKPRTPARRTLDLDVAVVQLNYTIDHREADPGALLLRRVVEVENLLQILGRDADPRIFDVDFDSTAGRTTGNLQRAAIRHRLAAVEREV